MLHYVVTQSGLNHKTENAEEAQTVPDGSTLHVFVDSAVLQDIQSQQTCISK